MSQGKGSGANGAAVGMQRFWCTPSIEAALAAELPPAANLCGFSHNGKHKYRVTVSARGLSASVGRLTQQQAAVAHDLLVTWRLHTTGRQHNKQSNELNFREAGYAADAALLDQLRGLHSAHDMQAFLMAVLGSIGNRSKTYQQKLSQQAEQGRQRWKREEQQKQQRAQRRMQRAVLVGRDEDAQAHGLGEPEPGTASPIAQPIGSRKRKQRSPVRVAPATMAGCNGQQQQAQQQLSQQQAEQGPAEYGEESLPPTRPASAAGVDAEAAGPMLPPELPSAMHELQRPADHELEAKKQQPSSSAATRSAAAAHFNNQPPPPRQFQLVQPQHLAAAAGAAKKAVATADIPQPAQLAQMPASQPAVTPAKRLPQPSPTSAALMATRAAEEARRKVEQAAQAFAAADRERPISMLRPLQHLLLALGRDASALAEVVASWPGYSIERQQEVFGAALAVTSEGDWGQLEGQLLLALDLTAEV